MNALRLVLLMLVALSPAIAQNAQPQPTSQAPVSYASMNQVNELLGSLQQTSQATLAQLNKLRILSDFAKVTPVTRIGERALEPGPIYRRARALYWDFAHGRAQRLRVVG